MSSCESVDDEFSKDTELYRLEVTYRVRALQTALSTEFSGLVSFGEFSYSPEPLIAEISALFNQVNKKSGKRDWWLVLKEELYAL
jgi:hypothetical protein